MCSVLHRTGMVMVSLVVAAWPGSVFAQEPPPSAHDDVVRLRAEVASLRAELESLKQLVTSRMLARDDVDSSGPSAAGEPVPEQVPAQDPRLEMIQTQIAELAQVKVESTSRQPLRVFGTIHTHAFANSGEANWMDVPNIVPPRPGDGATGTFSATVRQTRVGVTADGPRIGAARASGVLALDFFGGIPGFQTGQVMGLPRVLVGFARIETDRVAFQAGQDHVILAPRDPSSLAAFAFPLLFRSGNLYLRAPQARVEAAMSPRVKLTAGLLAPVAGDVPGEDYRFVPPALGGERSRHPALQAHLGYASDAADAERVVSLGVSGHWGRERRSGAFDQSWAGALDFAVRQGHVGFAGELFSGKNVDSFGGGLGLPDRASGGWLELQLFPSTRLAAHVGLGMDRLNDEIGGVPRRRNRTAYGNIRYALTPEIEAGLEYHWLGTLPGIGAERRNHHVDWVLVYRF